MTTQSTLELADTRLADTVITRDPNATIGGIPSRMRRTRALRAIVTASAMKRDEMFNLAGASLRSGDVAAAVALLSLSSECNQPCMTQEQKDFANG